MLTRTRDGTIKPPPKPLYPIEESNGERKSAKIKLLHNQLADDCESVKKFVGYLTNAIGNDPDDKQIIEDFELPENWTKVKSNIPPYRQLKQNYYKPPLQKPTFNEDDILVCNCSLTTGGCNDNCQNRLMFAECIPDYCHCVTKLPDGTYSHCGNSVIQHQLFPKTSVFPTPSCDFGLQADELIAPNTIIVEYMGEVITKAEFQARISSYSIKQHYYFAALEGQFILDANGMGSIARFANHSCEPNCIMQRWYVGTIPHIVLRSIKTIQLGEEITYSYGFTHDENYTNNPVYHQQCYCGSKYCNGMIGSASVIGKEIALIESKLESILGASEPIETDDDIVVPSNNNNKHDDENKDEDEKEMKTDEITPNEEENEEEITTTPVASSSSSSASVSRKRMRNWSKEMIIQYISSLKTHTNYASYCTASDNISEYITKVEEMLEEYTTLEKEYDQCIEQISTLTFQEQQLKTLLTTKLVCPTTVAVIKSNTIANNAAAGKSLNEEIEAFHLSCVGSHKLTANALLDEIQRLLLEFQQHPWKSIEYERYLQQYLEERITIQHEFQAFEQYRLKTNNNPPQQQQQQSEQIIQLQTKGKKWFWSDYIHLFERLYAYKLSPFLFIFPSSSFTSSLLPTELHHLNVVSSPQMMITSLLLPYQQIQSWCSKQILPYLPYALTQALARRNVIGSTTEQTNNNNATNIMTQQTRKKQLNLAAVLAKRKVSNNANKKAVVEEELLMINEYEKEYQLLLQLVVFLIALQSSPSLMKESNDKKKVYTVNNTILKQLLPFDMFGIVNYLDTFLSTHMIRYDAIVNLTSVVLTATATVIDPMTQQEVKQTSNNKRKSKGGGKSNKPKPVVKEEKKAAVNHDDVDDALHCYCQLQDNDLSENHPSDMIECTFCSRWFHTTCLNIPTHVNTAADVPSKAKAKSKSNSIATNKGLYLSTIRQLKTFYCCTCNLEVLGLNHYALTTSFQLLPTTSTSNATANATRKEQLYVEWKYVSASQKGKKKEVAIANNGVITSSTDDDVKKNHENNTMETTTSNAITTIIMKANNNKSITNPKHVVAATMNPNHRGYWYIEEFQQLVATADSQLMIQYNPVISLLTMLQTYLQQWQIRCNHYLHYILPICQSYIQDMITCIMQPFTLPSTTLYPLKEAILTTTRPSCTSMLHILITLLREPFLLHVQDTTTLLYLQSIIWCISTWVINYTILSTSAYSNYLYLMKYYYLLHKQKVTNDVDDVVRSFKVQQTTEQKKSPLFTLEDIQKCVVTGNTYCQLLQWTVLQQQQQRALLPSESHHQVAEKILQLVTQQSKLLQSVYTVYSTVWERSTTCQTMESFIHKNNNNNVSGEYDDYSLIQALSTLVNIDKTFAYAKVCSFHHHHQQQQQQTPPKKSQNADATNAAPSENTTDNHMIMAPIAMTATTTVVEEPEGEGEVEVYCWCRKVVATEENNLIGCDGCGEWFHYSCVGLIPSSSSSSSKRRKSNPIVADTTATDSIEVVSQTNNNETMLMKEEEESDPANIIAAATETTEKTEEEGNKDDNNKKRKRNPSKNATVTTAASKKKAVDVEALESYYCIACSLSSNNNKKKAEGEEVMIAAYPYMW